MPVRACDVGKLKPEVLGRSSVLAHDRRDMPQFIVKGSIKEFEVLSARLYNRLL